MAPFISNRISSMGDPFGETAKTVRRLESGHPIAGAEVVVAGIIMSFASYALVKISR